MALAFSWIALGIAIAVGAFRMDRLAHLNVEPWSAPGLVPGVLGVLIAAFGALLAWGERKAAGDAAARQPIAGPATEPPVVARLAGVLALVAVFVFGLLGRGLPFVATSSALVFAWIALLRWRQWRADGRLARGLAGAATIALGACLAIAHLFQDVFLVRLP
jgi:hypothetical protein